MPITGARWALESLLEIRSFAQFTPWSIIFRIAIYITNYIIYILYYNIYYIYIIL